jgi:hypothetical protein
LFSGRLLAILRSVGKIGPPCRIACDPFVVIVKAVVGTRSRLSTNTANLHGRRQMSFSMNRQIRAGRICASLVVSFLLFDAVGKLLAVPPVVAGTIELGYSGSLVVLLGVIELACTALYVLPRTTVLGAILSEPSF